MSASTSRLTLFEQALREEFMEGYRVEWFSPGQPTPRRLAEPACDARVRIAAGRIAYRAGGRDDERLVLGALDGGPAHTVARMVQSRRSARDIRLGRRARGLR